MHTSEACLSIQLNEQLSVCTVQQLRKLKYRLGVDLILSLVTIMSDRDIPAPENEKNHD